MSYDGARVLDVGPKAALTSACEPGLKVSTKGKMHLSRICSSTVRSPWENLDTGPSHPPLWNTLVDRKVTVARAGGRPASTKNPIRQIKCFQ